MTSPGEWNPSLLDDAPNASETRLNSFQTTHMEQTEMFYNMEGDIVVQRSDIVSDDDISIVSDTPSTSSGNRRCSYRSRTRHEKKKRALSKGRSNYVYQMVG